MFVNILKDCKYAIGGLYVKEFKQGEFVELDDKTANDFLRLGWAYNVEAIVDAAEELAKIEEPKKRGRKSKAE